LPQLVRDAALADVHTEIRLAPTSTENVEAVCDAVAPMLLAADMMSPAEIEECSLTLVTRPTRCGAL
jgi:hypothetical protein